MTISNDGATIMKTLDIVHPAAKVLVDISLSQDAEVGDGTTTVVLLAAEFLRECKAFIEEGVHPQASAPALPGRAGQSRAESCPWTPGPGTPAAEAGPGGSGAGADLSRSAPGWHTLSPWARAHAP